MDEAGSSKKTPSQQITINQIRDLDDFLHVGTHRHGARIVLINPAEAMNRATANALLKSLEEPVAGTLFILINSEPHLLLPTIRSRCQRIFIRPPSFATAVSWLQHAGLGVHAERWLALAGGSPLLALELANSQESEILETLIPCLIQTETFDPLQAAFTIDRVIKADKSGHRLQRTLEWAQKWLFDLALVSYGMSPRYFLEHCLLMQRLVRATDARRLLAFGRKALQYRDQCRQPLNSRLFLEDFFLDYARIFRNS